MFMWAPSDAPRGTTSPYSRGRPPVQGMPLCFWEDECPINTSGDNVTCDGAGSDTDWAALQRARLSVPKLQLVSRLRRNAVGDALSRGTPRNEIWALSE